MPQRPRVPSEKQIPAGEARFVSLGQPNGAGSREDRIHTKFTGSARRLLQASSFHLCFPLGTMMAARVPLTKNQVRGFWAAWAGWALDGMDSFIYALVLVPALQDLLPRSGIAPTTANVGYYGGLLFAVFLIGWGMALLWGPVADRFGRVRTLMLTIVCFSLFTLLSAFSPNVWTLAVLRLFAGVGIGGEWAMGATLVSEEWPEERRTMGAGMMHTGYYFGFFLAALANYFVGSRFGWRWMFVVGGAPTRSSGSCSACSFWVWAGRITRSISFDATGPGVTFVAAPLSADTEITGPSAVKLFVSSSTEDADIFVVLRVFSPAMEEVVFQGAIDPHTPIGQGWLRASHRKLEPALSKPWRPYHTHDERQRLKPGEAVELDVEIWPTSIVAPAGYRIALTIRGKDYEHACSGGKLSNFKNELRGCGPFLHNDPADRPAKLFAGKTTLHAETSRQPFLLLPIIPRKHPV
jgi:hypothetical protein